MLGPDNLVFRLFGVTFIPHRLSDLGLIFTGLISIIHSDISSRHSFRQGASEEPAEQPGSAVSRHRSEQRSMMGWIGLMSLCIAFGDYRDRYDPFLFQNICIYAACSDSLDKDR